ncbi:uracil-DNA glycosylase [Candidatus Fermentibacterales bacterium]|nr:uracil-DNA glycosylase [Candidatus Fermentibacterales bacterium]
MIESFGLERVYLRRPADAGPTASAGEPRGPGPGPGESVEMLLAALRERVGDCKSCGLSESRTRIVMGEGNPDAGIMLVGEGPGRTEDETGRPFVGKAGQLLDRILASIELDRDKVFITNVVKCRPTGNRTPSDSEIAACFWILEEQISAMRPGLICALGAPAARTLTGLRRGIGQMRGEIQRFGRIPVVVTYHPAALLRSPALKRPVWEDMKRMRDLLVELGLPRC